MHFFSYESNKAKLCLFFFNHVMTNLGKQRIERKHVYWNWIFKNLNFYQIQIIIIIDDDRIGFSFFFQTTTTARIYHDNAYACWESIMNIFWFWKISKKKIQCLSCCRIMMLNDNGNIGIGIDFCFQTSKYGFNS